jgi:hypothetical protein
MTAATGAGALYALTIFLIGFVLGTIRVLLIAPRLGETGAVLLETPSSWLACRWCVDRLHVTRKFLSRSLIGVVAFLVLMAAEFALGRLAFGRSTGEQLAGYGSVPRRNRACGSGRVRDLPTGASLETVAGQHLC